MRFVSFVVVLLFESGEQFLFLARHLLIIRYLQVFSLGVLFGGWLNLVADSVGFVLSPLCRVHQSFIHIFISKFQVFIQI